MSRRPKNPLRPLLEEERAQLMHWSRGQAIAASPVARAKAVLAVADGSNYTDAARAAGRQSGDAPEWVTSRQYLHDLARVGGRGFELAKAPVVVQHRYRPATVEAGGSDGGGDRDRSGCRGEKKLIEPAYREGSRLGLAVWCADEAGPYPAIPRPGASWRPVGEPIRYPHESIRGGTAKLLTLFHPVTGEVRVKGVTHSAYFAG